MSIIRWNPWNLDRIFEDDWGLPAMPGVSRIIGQGLNIYETEAELVAEAAVPGVSEDKIDVTFENSVVRISAVTEDREEEKEKRRYFMTSMTSSFNYSFRVPEGFVGTDEPDAELEDGVLRLRFKKVQKKEPKKIKVAKKLKNPESGIVS